MKTVKISKNSRASVTSKASICGKCFPKILWILFFSIPNLLHSYSFQFQNLVLIDFSLSGSNFSTEDVNERPDPFAFSLEPGIRRGTLMPQASAKILLVLRNRYMLQFEAMLHSLRNQQTNFAFGLGNEGAGLLFGVAQEFTVASLSQPNKLGMGAYAKIFYTIPRAMDLQFEATFLTNALFSTNRYYNIYVNIHALFMISQFRFGLTSTIHFFSAEVAKLTFIQGQVNLLAGGYAPSRLFNVDFYLATTGIINQNDQVNNYSLLYFGFGTILEFVLNPYAVFGAFFEIFPIGLSLSGIGNINADNPALTLGFNGRFRIFRKELWKPEVIPRRIPENF